MMKTIVWSTFAALFLSLTGNVSSNAFGQFPEPRSAYKLKDVIVTSYGLSGNAAVDASRALGVTLGYTKVEWTYLKPGGKSKAGYTEVE
jgi:type VI protein secretion system component Hcp